MAKELHHYNFNALGEPIRYIIRYTKREFEDIRHELANWPLQDVQPDVQSGQLSLYAEGERVLAKSLAIAKYVAMNTDLVPEDPWIQAVVESATYTIYGFWSKVLTYVTEGNPIKKKAIKKELLEGTIDLFFSRIEKDLQENGGYFGGKLSWGEFVLCGIVEASNLILDIELEKNYPTVEAIVKKVRNLPGVKEYIASRGTFDPYEETTRTSFSFQ